MPYVRSSLISRSGYSGMGAFTDDTPCTDIPAGDPYRSPGHWCMANGEMLQFDDQGNVHPTGTAPSSPSSSKSSGGALSFLTESPLLAIGVLAGAFILFGRKKGRR